MLDQTETTTISATPTTTLPAWVQTVEQAAEYIKNTAELDRRVRVKGKIHGILDAENGLWEYPPDSGNRLEVLTDLLLEEFDEAKAGRLLVLNTLACLSREALYEVDYREYREKQQGVALPDAKD